MKLECLSLPTATGLSAPTSLGVRSLLSRRVGSFARGFFGRSIGALLICLLAMPAAAVTSTVSGSAASTVTLTSSANPVTFGQLLFLTAKVTSTDGVTPSGEITFNDGANPVLTFDLDENGEGVLLITSTMAPGTHAISASYAGDGSHAAAVSEVLQQVIAPPLSRTVLSSSLNPAAARQAVTFTANVSSGHWQAPAPTGTVSFLDGGTPLGSAPLDASARASFTTTALSAGTHTITAVYAGDSGNLGSTSSAVEQAIDPATIDVAVTLSTDPPPACGARADLAVVSGTPVNYCFTVTNHTAETLRYHTLSSDVHEFSATQNGDAFENVLFELEIAPGASARYNKVAVAASSTDRSFTWSAFAATPTYAVDDAGVLDYVDIAAIGTSVPGGGTPVALPFEFTLYGRTFLGGAIDALCLYNNGAAQFVARSEYCGGNFPLFGSDDWVPPPPDANDSLLPYWDALGSAGAVRYATVGTTPNRRFVVEWRGKNHRDQAAAGLDCDPAAPSCGISFELILDESSGAITFSYADVEFDTVGGDSLHIDRGGSAYVALIDGTRALRQEYSVRQPSLADGRSVRWSPLQPPYLRHLQSRLAVGVPHIATAPETVAATAAPGEVRIRPLAIRNEGDHVLEWNLGRVPADAHLPLQPRRVAPVGDPSRTSLKQPAGDFAPASAGASPAPFPTAVFELPAYGVKTEPGQFTQLVGLDVAEPGPFVRVGIAYETLAGDFAGNDFSKEYVFTQCVAAAGECFASIDTASGEVGEIAASTVPAGQAWNGMAWDATRATLFGSTSTCVAEQKRSYLYRIDPLSGVQTLVAEIDTGGDVCIVDIAVAPNGLMYGLDIDNDALVAVDSETGAAAAIGSIGFDANYTQSMDFDDASGVLYLAGSSDPLPPLTAMYTVDLVSGAATRSGRFDYGYPSTWMTLAGLAIATPGGSCARPGEVPWLFYDETAGSTAPGGESSARVVLDASALEPGSYSARLCIHSNDPARAMLAVPVELTVEEAPGEMLFADGFERSP